MKIVITDKKTLTNNDISLDVFDKYGEVTAYDITPNDMAAERICDTEILLCNKTLITEEVMDACPNLKYIGLFATGYNNVDISAAVKRGITVCNAGEYSTMAVAQHVFAFLLAFYSHIGEYDRSVHNGDWLKSDTFSYFLNGVSAVELCGKTLGIIGFGSIGKTVAKIADAFGMKVIISTRTIPREGYPYEFVSREEIFSRADVVTLHCPLTEQTSGMVNRETLSIMKPTAFLINTSRGGTVVEEDLAEALNNGTIAGAAADVISHEPMLETNPLFTAKNCIITPHVAWAPKETRERLIAIAAENLKCFLEGKPQNVIHE